MLGAGELVSTYLSVIKREASNENMPLPPGSGAGQASYHIAIAARTENAINEGARHAMAAETAAHPKIKIPTNMLSSPCDSLHICLELNVLAQLQLRKYLWYIV